MRQSILLSCILLLIASGCKNPDMTKIGVNSKESTITAAPKSDSNKEGTVNGGGGKGILCKVNSTTTLETLDLYEAREVYGLDAGPAFKTKEEGINYISEKLATHFWVPDYQEKDQLKKHYSDNLQKFFSHKLKFVKDGITLKDTKDSNEPFISKNCEIVQIANFYNESVILIDQKLWEKLDIKNQLSLIVHEELYKIERQSGIKSSVSTRKLVGQLFSKKGSIAKSTGWKDGDILESCYIYKDLALVGDFFKMTDKNKKEVNIIFNQFFETGSLFNSRIEAIEGQKIGKNLFLDGQSIGLIVSIDFDKGELKISDSLAGKNENRNYTFQCDKRL